MMLASNVVPPFTVERWACAGLPLGLRRTLVAFADETRPATEAASYLEARWERYPELRIGCGATGIEAFALVHPFMLEGERHLYIGPLFSRRRAYVQLFAWLLRELLDGESAWHVAAEIEHPAVLDAFARLLPSCVGARGGAVSLPARRIACRFRDELPHIRDLQLTRLCTRVEAPLFVDPSRRHGFAQLVVVSCDGSAADRLALRAELCAGLSALGRAP
jgi:hypothetical protein